VNREAIATAHRVVVKVGSSSLTSSGRLDPERLDRLVDALAAQRAAGRQVVLVSSGAIAAGIEPLGLRARPRDLATQQAAASVGQLLLAERYAASFARHGVQVGQVLPVVKNHWQTLYEMDKTILHRAPWLARYASIRVISLVK